MLDTDTLQQHNTHVTHTLTALTLQSFVYVQKYFITRTRTRTFFNAAAPTIFSTRKKCFTPLLELWTDVLSVALFEDKFAHRCSCLVEFFRVPGRIYSYYANIITWHHRRYCSEEPIRNPNGFSFTLFVNPEKPLVTIRVCVRYLYRSMVITCIGKTPRVFMVDSG